MNNETQHTPGPWIATKNEKLKVIEIFSESEKEFKTNAPFRIGIITRNIDARLIASAPSLLKENQELKASLTMICNYVSMREFDVNVLRAMVEQTKIDLNGK
jgi:hypothetical protein